jgi:hypothetical protein
MIDNALYAFGRELLLLLAYEAANLTYAAAATAMVAGYRQLSGRYLGSGPVFRVGHRTPRTDHAVPLFR